MKIGIYLGVILLGICFSCKKDPVSRLESVDLLVLYGEDSCRFVQPDGKEMLVSNYKESSLGYDGMFLVKDQADGKWGYADEDGNYLLPSVYRSASVFSEGKAWVVRQNEAPGLIDTKGRLKFTLRDAYETRIFRDGLAAYSLRNGKWGFVDGKGNTIIIPDYIAVTDFINGIAAVCFRDNRWGYIRRDGSLIFDKKFETAFPFSQNSLAVVKEGGKYKVINREGKEIFVSQGDKLLPDGKWFRILQAGKWGWCNEKGEIIIKPVFEETGYFYDEGLAPVKIRKKWGYIDTKGRMKIKRQFREAYPFIGERAAVRVDNSYGFIDKSGRFIVNPQYNAISDDYLSQALQGSSYYNSVVTDVVRR